MLDYKGQVSEERRGATQHVLSPGVGHSTPNCARGFPGKWAMAQEHSDSASSVCPVTIPKKSALFNRVSQPPMNLQRLSVFGRRLQCARLSQWCSFQTRPSSLNRYYAPKRFMTTQPWARPTVTVTKPIVGHWLYFNAGLVFSIVVVGGLTRLTESGLSITEWNVISGMKPPRSELEWHEEFEKYKQFPEYKLLNRHMTLDEFKSIFYWEWSHRMIGRFIGATFIIPGLYFASRGYMTRRVAKQTFGITCLLGLQGFMGWYMVKSGLSDALMKEPGSVPRVSQYRLTSHLALAFSIYGASLFVGADVLRQHKIATGTYPKHTAAMLNSPVLKRFRMSSHLACGLIFLTAMTGGLVAGLDAGLIYNEFPYMGQGLIPPKNELWSDDFVKKDDRGKWRNLLENPTTVQFDHRTLAETTAVAVTSLWLYSRRLPLPKNARFAVNTMMGAVCVQVTLGICTLIYMVPIQLAAAHQAGALALLTSNFWLIHALRRVPL